MILRTVFCIAVACTLAVLAIAFASGERSAGGGQDPAAAQVPGYRIDSWRDQLRSRTLKQGEAGRIGS